MSVHRPGDADPLAALMAYVDAERSDEPFLLFSDRDGREQLFVFEPASVSLSVGRQPSSGLKLDWDNEVSREHARFERVHDDWTLVDDGPSRNGTFVNEERLTSTRRLNDGDMLRFGNTTVKFHSRNREQSGGATTPVSPPPEVTPARAVSPVHLSSTQRRVLLAMCRPCNHRSGFLSPATDEEIADDLFLSVGEVKAHINVLSAKLGVGKPPGAEARIELLERAFSAGLISGSDV